jgi:hypothetical protein
MSHSIGGMKPEPAFELTFSSTRFVSFERVTRNRVHRHSFYEPCIVISGTGEFEHGAEQYALREGDLFIADPGIYHEIRSLKTKDLQLYFLAFNATRILRVRRREERQPSIIRQILPAFASITACTCQGSRIWSRCSNMPQNCRGMTSARFQIRSIGTLRCCC